MKNYKKILNRLIKEVKESKKSELERGTHKVSSKKDILDYVETQYAISVYGVLEDIIDEVMGKKCHNMIMTPEEFKEWKKEINLEVRE